MTLMQLYLLSVLFGMICNFNTYKAFTESEGEKKVELLSRLIVRLLLGPLSVYINIKNIYIYAHQSIQNYLLRKKIEKALQKEIEKALIAACEEAGIKIVD